MSYLNRYNTGRENIQWADVTVSKTYLENIFTYETITAKDDSTYNLIINYVIDNGQFLSSGFQNAGTQRLFTLFLNIEDVYYNCIYCTFSNAIEMDYIAEDPDASFPAYNTNYSEIHIYNLANESYTNIRKFIDHKNIDIIFNYLALSAIPNQITYHGNICSNNGSNTYAENVPVNDRTRYHRNDIMLYNRIALPFDSAFYNYHEHPIIIRINE